jgi:hypothetical protein
MVDARASWTERRATRGTGWFARLAARTLIRRLWRRFRYRHVLEVTRLLWHARDVQVLRMARAALEELWNSWPGKADMIWHGLLEAADGDPPPAVVDFLLAPVPHSRYVRIVTAMDDYRGVRAGPALVGWLDNAEVAALLRGTDHPELLHELALGFLSGLTYPAELWTKGCPTPLLRVLMDNPHLPRPRHEIRSNELPVLALLKGRTDLLEQYDPEDLVDALVRTAARKLPRDVVGACRRVLRELPPGPGRERLCKLAMDLELEARAAVIEAGFVPEAPEHLAMFLFCSEQWERYDEEDPLGEKLHRHKRSYRAEDFVRLKRTADSSGRPAPRNSLPPQSQPVRAGRDERRKDFSTRAERRAERRRAARGGVPRSASYRPGGTGISGSGGFANPGNFGGFGV